MTADESMLRYLGRMVGEGRVSTSSVVEGELRFGIARMPRGRKRKRLEDALGVVLENVDGVLAVDRLVASRYAQLKSKLWTAGRPIGENDLWIAATAVAGNLVLVTKDRGFDHVPDLKLEDWSGG